MCGEGEKEMEKESAPQDKTIATES